MASALSSLTTSSSWRLLTRKLMTPWCSKLRKSHVPLNPLPENLMCRYLPFHSFLVPLSSAAASLDSLTFATQDVSQETPLFSGQILASEYLLKTLWDKLMCL